MTALPDALAAKVGKIVGQFGSDNPHVVTTAVAMLRRTLSSNGCDLNDLAVHITEKPREVVVYRERQAKPEPRPFDYGSWRQTWSGCDPRRQHKARVDVLQADRSGFLTDWEFAFVRSLGRQLAEGRRVSPKQVTILNDLHARYVERYG
jgi:hypothetical protein